MIRVALHGVKPLMGSYLQGPLCPVGQAFKKNPYAFSCFQKSSLKDLLLNKNHAKLSSFIKRNFFHVSKKKYLINQTQDVKQPKDVRNVCINNTRFAIE